MRECDELARWFRFAAENLKGEARRWAGSAGGFWFVDFWGFFG